MANVVDELIEGCNTANECLTKYWRTIWIIIALAILAYAIMVAWTCWLSSKSKKIARRNYSYEQRKFYDF